MRSTVENDVKFLFGDQALENLMYELYIRGIKSPMFVCDDMARRLGYKRELFRAVDGNGCDIACIDQRVEDIASVQDVERIVRLYATNNCDCIIGMGRKGLVQAVKAAKILLRDGVSTMAHYDTHAVGEYPARNVPMFLIPTNLASGSECMDVARIYDTKQNKVYAFDTAYASTQVVVADRRMSDIIPPKAVASYGLCAFSMACAGCLYEPQVFVRPYAESALEILNRTLTPCIVHNADANLRTALMSAVILSGCGYGNLHKHLLTELSDILSDRYRINFNNVFAVLFRRYVQMHENDPLRMEQLLLSLIGEHEWAMCTPAGRAAKAAECIEAVFAQVCEKVDYMDHLSELGVERSDFAAIAEQVIAQHGDKADPEATYSFISQWLEASY